MIQRFDAVSFHSICGELAKKDPELAGILEKYGPPPMWNRPPSFSTLIHIILEQQVSLASALAAFTRLQERLGGNISPEGLLSLDDETLRACYFSRQKAGYARHLAQALAGGELDLEAMQDSPDDHIRLSLKKIKGIGDWTADIYLIFALQRSDVFPVGDLAMINAFREVKNLPPATPRGRLVELAEAWRPNRSVATMLLWHHYLSRRRK